MKKINIINGLLLAYLVVMSVVGWPGNQPDPDYKQYFLIMGITLAIILLLRYVQVRRLKMREKQKKEEE
jgi:Na+/melibiose symporter-like transporter